MYVRACARLYAFNLHISDLEGLRTCILVSITLHGKIYILPCMLVVSASVYLSVCRCVYVYQQKRGPFASVKSFGEIAIFFSEQLVD